MEIKNKRVVVTGAASGIGYALCEEFHTSGAQSIVCVDLYEDGTMEIAEKINYLFNFSARESMGRKARELAEQFPSERNNREMLEIYKSII